MTNVLVRRDFRKLTNISDPQNVTIVLASGSIERIGISFFSFPYTHLYLARKRVCHVGIS